MYKNINISIWSVSTDKDTHTHTVLCFTEELNQSEQRKSASEPIRARLINIQIHICRIKPQPWLSNLSGNLMNLPCTLFLCLAQPSPFHQVIQYWWYTHINKQAHKHKVDKQINHKCSEMHHYKPWKPINNRSIYVYACAHLYVSACNSIQCVLVLMLLHISICMFCVYA